MTRSRRIPFIALVVFSTGPTITSLRAQTVTTYSNLGPGDSYLDGSQAADPPLTVGGDSSVQANAMWAMPFTPSIMGGAISDIFIALASCQGFVGTNQIQINILSDNEVNGVSLGPGPTLIYNHPVYEDFL